ncbi:hypothetical protein [Cognatishimia activa]|uniref:hypothetical protein n=1 Tax=Cognatishimia activa TaxID=1715691 RepID=UPI00222E4632|nr:hypothetical protein [Cognatishimia activa]UZD89804.1 hypothetical protein M0D42_09385 [Cognatishimia activa]
MKFAVHLLISVQLVLWAGYMVVAYLAPDEKLPAQTLEGFLFLCVVAIILCFFPALRMARSYEMQPFAFIIASLPIIAVAAIVIIQLI